MTRKAQMRACARHGQGDVSGQGPRMQWRAWVEADPFQYLPGPETGGTDRRGRLWLRTFMLGFASTLGLGLVVLPERAPALELELFDGDLVVSMASSLQWGAAASIDEAAESIIYYQHGGSAAVPLNDDSRFAYDHGDDLVANQVKAKTSIDVSVGEITARGKFLGFYDFDFMDHARGYHPGRQRRVEYTDDVNDLVGRDLRVQELYASWDTYFGDHPFTLRVGEQVINWGQATLIPGLNITNPLNLNRLFSPTFELDELYNPLGAAVLSFGFTDTFSIEAYYQWDYEPFELPPAGTFFGIQDVLGAGINDAGQGYVCVGGPKDGYGDAGPDGGNDGGWCGLMDPTRYPQAGEFGIRLNLTVEALNYTEFSLYYLNMNSKLPTYNAIAGVIPNAACPLPLIPGSDPADDDTPCPLPDPDQYARVFIEYPDGVEMYGLSWATTLPWGLSWAGELSVKNNFPVQYDLEELFSAAAYADIDGAGPVPPVPARDNPPVPILPAQDLPTGLPLAEIGELVQGYQRLDVAQAQFTLTKLWPGALGGDTLISLVEVGYTRVLRMPDSVGFFTEDFGDPATADASGWGYRMLLINEYSAVFGSNWTLKPILLLAQDVKGVLPGNLGSFIEDQKMAVAFIEAEHPSGFFVNAKLQRFWGGEKKSVFQDKDNVSLSIGVRF